MEDSAQAPKIPAPAACEWVEEGGFDLPWLHLGLSSLRNGHGDQSSEILALGEQDQNEKGWL